MYSYPVSDETTEAVKTRVDHERLSGLTHEIEEHFHAMVRILNAAYPPADANHAKRLFQRLTHLR